MIVQPTPVANAQIGMVEEVARWNDFGLLARRGNARMKLFSEVPVRPRSSTISVLIGLFVVGCSGSDAGSG